MKKTIFAMALAAACFSGAVMAKDVKLEKSTTVANKAMTDADLDKVVGAYGGNFYGQGYGAPGNGSGQGTSNASCQSRVAYC